MKVRVICELKFWYDGSGFGHSETLEDRIIDLEYIPTEWDWNWWEKDDGEFNWDDIYITVIYLNDNNDVLGMWETWESDII